MRACCTKVLNQVKSSTQRESQKSNIEDKKGTNENMSSKGAYLVFDSASQGSLFIIWKNEKVPNALAFIKPSKPVPEFKYKTNNGKSEIVRNLQSDKKSFYFGVCQFIKEAKDIKADVVLLPAVDTASPLKFEVYCLKSNTVTNVKIGSPFTVHDIDAICILPKGSSALEVKTMKKDLFLNRGNAEGASIAF